MEKVWKKGLLKKICKIKHKDNNTQASEEEHDKLRKFYIPVQYFMILRTFLR